MTLTPLVAVHMTAALLATATGPVALWARMGRLRRPKLHRAFGYAWVTVMIVAAGSAFFIHSTAALSYAGFSPIHLLIPVTFGNIAWAFVALARGNYVLHRFVMLSVYFGSCVVAGLFTLVPGRYLGDLLWGRLLGLTW